MEPDFIMNLSGGCSMKYLTKEWYELCQQTGLSRRRAMTNKPKVHLIPDKPPKWEKQVGIY